MNSTELFSWRGYLELCKPRVVALMLLTAIVGMQLATPSLIPLKPLVFGILGIGLMASGAAAVNHLVERYSDSLMMRTQRRPLPSGKISPWQASLFAAVLSVSGMLVLMKWVNNLTAFLTLGTFIGYAGIYTLYLKRATPQNIVIGGASGALPPLLGWTAITGHLDPQAFLLVAIIFVWTPPHFWALAIARHQDYLKADLPMLPITHGIRFTKISIFLYSLLLLAVSVLPFVIGLSGVFYFSCVLLLDIGFLYFSVKLLRNDSVAVAMQTFRYSIWYLMILFVVLLIDHFI